MEHEDVAFEDVAFEDVSFEDVDSWHKPAVCDCPVAFVHPGGSTVFRFSLPLMASIKPEA